MKYYKTTPIEAVQFLSFDETHFSERPAWLLEAIDNQTIQFFGTRDKLDIQTLEGMMQAKVGDYLIRGAHGEIYACDKDIFHETYAPVKEDADNEEED